MVYLVAKGCPTCEDLKKKGLCRVNKCVEISTKQGQKIAKEAGVDAVPQKVCKTRNGRIVKCSPSKTEKKKYGVA